MSLFDAILHIANMPALLDTLAASEPWRLDEDGTSFSELSSTPAVDKPPARMIYARLTAQELETWRATPGVKVLAQAEYTGPDTADAVYATLFSDPDAMAIYEEVYDRTPRKFKERKGETFTVTPPPRFGQIG